MQKSCLCFLCSVINQGDEVILFDPSYETYETCIRLAGGVPVSNFITMLLYLTTSHTMQVLSHLD